MKREIGFLILGLTGPIGAGCTTLSKNIMSKLHTNKMISKGNLLENVKEEINNISAKMNELDKEVNENELKRKNKKLKTLLEKRNYLKIVQNTKDPTFKYISMSSLILKLAVENIDTKPFNKWRKKNKKLSDLITNFKKDWSNILNLYNKQDKLIKNYSKNELDNIDKMFKQLDLMKEKWKNYEMENYFNGNLDKFHLQIFGNNLRNTGNPFNHSKNQKGRQLKNNLNIIAKEANKIIKYYRNRTDKKQTDYFIIDAFRNPAEINFFRRYEEFYLISLYADRKTREKRLKRNLKTKVEIDNDRFSKYFKKIDNRDWGDDLTSSSIHKQNVSRCSYLSDIAINNNEHSEEFNYELFEKFLRYYALIIKPGCVKPSKEETNMNLAYSLSLRSNCISRQVGAVITDNKESVLGFGWNETGHTEIGCGLKMKQDFIKDKLFNIDIFKEVLDENDLEVFANDDSICFKDTLSKNKVKNKVKEIINENRKDFLDILDTKNQQNPQKQLENLQNKLLEELKIKRLEYCRSLHAEENALLQVASRGGMGVDQGTIYTTTFPCELCAKKIYQSGISKIYYTEPYPNSISENVFLQDGVRNITVKQFEGVKSFSYFKLFNPKVDKKEAQKINKNIGYPLF